MIFAWIAFGGWWWWILTLVMIGVITAMSDEDLWLPGMCVFMGWLIIVSLFGTMPVWPWLGSLTLVNGLKWFGGYFLLGLGWSYFKWYTRLKKFKNAIVDMKKTWDLKGDSFQIQYDKNFDQYVQKKLGWDKKGKAKWEKDEVIFWIVLWPWSLLYFCLKDLMRFLVEDVLKGSYMWFRKRVLGDFVKYIDD